jgi:hypothetical protein
MCIILTVQCILMINFAEYAIIVILISTECQWILRMTLWKKVLSPT